jgi:hypothetical protein
MAFIHYLITVNLRMILKTSYISNYILHRSRDLTYQTNASLAIGFVIGYATIEFVETSYITNYILHRPRDLTCLTNAFLAIGFVSGSATLKFVEMCFRIMSYSVIAFLM